MSKKSVPASNVLKISPGPFSIYLICMLQENGKSPPITITQALDNINPGSQVPAVPFKIQSQHLKHKLDMYVAREWEEISHHNRSGIGHF